MTRIDRKSITLLKAIAENLENAESGFEQYFTFVIRGKRIHGSLKVSIEEEKKKVTKR